MFSKSCDDKFGYFIKKSIANASLFLLLLFFQSTAETIDLENQTQKILSTL